MDLYLEYGLSMLAVTLGMCLQCVYLHVLNFLDLKALRVQPPVLNRYVFNIIDSS